MKHVVTSLITAMSHSRSGHARVGERTGAQAQGTPMTQLTTEQLRHIAGGEMQGPHGSWSIPSINQ
jgi:hypothetical protein